MWDVTQVNSNNNNKWATHDVNENLKPPSWVETNTHVDGDFFLSSLHSAQLFVDFAHSRARSWSNTNPQLIYRDSKGCNQHRFSNYGDYVMLWRTMRCIAYCIDIASPSTAINGFYSTYELVLIFYLFFCFQLFKVAPLWLVYNNNFHDWMLRNCNMNFCTMHSLDWVCIFKAKCMLVNMVDARLRH